MSSLKKETPCDYLEFPYGKIIIILLILLSGVFFSCPAYASRMPGAMDYALLILLVSFIAGVVVATVVTLILFLIFKQKYSRKNYLKWWVGIALAFPISGHVGLWNRARDITTRIKYKQGFGEDYR